MKMRLAKLAVCFTVASLEGVEALQQPLYMPIMRTTGTSSDPVHVPLCRAEVW